MAKKGSGVFKSQGPEKGSGVFKSHAAAIRRLVVQGVVRMPAAGCLTAGDDDLTVDTVDVSAVRSASEAPAGLGRNRPCRFMCGDG